jgi:hypothetical protein
LRASAIPGVTDQQAVLAGGSVGEIGVVRIGGHGNGVAGVQAVVGAIPADGLAEPVAAPGAQRQGGAAFLAVADPPHLGEPL